MQPITISFEGTSAPTPTCLTTIGGTTCEACKPSLQSYRKTSLGFPVGGGVAMTINNDLRIGLEFVWNLTLTDYLDDVSTT